MDLVLLAVVLAASFLPPLLYVLWIRDAETCRRESLRSVARAFLIGATLSIGIAILIEALVLDLLFGMGSASLLDPSDEALVALVGTVLMAPFVEEMAKMIGVMGMRPWIKELEDGLVYGASVGLGFAAVENMIYAGSATALGFLVVVTLAAIRAVTSTLLHASTTATTGYGLGRRWIMARLGTKAGWIGFYLLAVALHSSYNILAILGLLSPDSGEAIGLIGLGGAALLAIVAFLVIRSRIVSMDRNWCPPINPS